MGHMISKLVSYIPVGRVQIILFQKSKDAEVFAFFMQILCLFHGI